MVSSERSETGAGRQNVQDSAEECFLSEHRDSELTPIHVALHAQQIGKMFADHTKPFAFKQALLEEFRAAGAPVSGIVLLRLDHGHVFKLTSSPLGKEWIAYCWMPQELYRRLVEFRKSQGEDVTVLERCAVV